MKTLVKSMYIGKTAYIYIYIYANRIYISYIPCKNIKTVKFDFFFAPTTLYIMDIGLGFSVINDN